MGLLLAFVWLGAVTFFLFRLVRTFGQLTGRVKEGDLKQVLDEILKTVKQSHEERRQLAQEIERLRLEGLGSIQKVGLVRYNPFSDTGGNQSFVLALLDGKDCGFVITSLHSRESTRVFAKPVTGGKEKDFEFSKEEAQAIKEAQKEKRGDK
jgi:hypothetical protein